jgi:hypothetical protein
MVRLAVETVGFNGDLGLVAGIVRSGSAGWP